MSSAPSDGFKVAKRKDLSIVYGKLARLHGRGVALDRETLAFIRGMELGIAALINKPTLLDIDRFADLANELIDLKSKYGITPFAIEDDI